MGMKQQEENQQEKLEGWHKRGSKHEAAVVNDVTVDINENVITENGLKQATTNDETVEEILRELDNIEMKKTSQSQ